MLATGVRKISDASGMSDSLPKWGHGSIVSIV